MKVEFYRQLNHVPREVIDFHKAKTFDRVEFLASLHYDGWTPAYSAKSMLLTRRLRSRTITVTVRDESVHGFLTVDLDVLTKATGAVKSNRTKYTRYGEAVVAVQTMLDKYGRSAAPVAIANEEVQHACCLEEQ